MEKKGERKNILAINSHLNTILMIDGRVKEKGGRLTFFWEQENFFFE
jgi:hypothetical protein